VAEPLSDEPYSLPYFPGYPRGARMSMMRPEGTGSLGVLVMGEALGEHEAHDGLPFRPYAEAGSVLERAFAECGYDRSQFLLSNVVWYRPPKNWLEHAPWEHEAIAICRPLNVRLIEERQPRCILALGGIAMREMTGLTGPKRGIRMVRGFIVDSVHGIPCVGSYHPSFLRRGSKERSKDTGARTEGAAGKGMDLLGVLRRDIELAVWVAKHGWPKRKPVEYRLHCGLDDFRTIIADARAHPDLMAIWDLENPLTLAADDESEAEPSRELTQFQVSLRPQEAWVWDWRPDLVPLIRELMALSNPKGGWNDRLYDRPLLAELDIRLEGERHDLMDRWHHCQPDLPKGLQFAASFFAPEEGPWKHLNDRDPHLYGAKDVDYPQRILAKLPGQMRGLAVASGLDLNTGYERYVCGLARVLDHMTERGVPVNEGRRQEFRKLIEGDQERLRAEVTSLVPDEVLGVKQREGYKKPPGELLTRLRELRQPMLQTTACDKSEPGPMMTAVEKSEPTRVMTASEVSEPGGGMTACSRSDPQRVEAGGHIYMRRPFPAADNPNGNLFGEATTVERWAQLLPFNPRSSDQVVRYIEHRRREEIAAMMAKGKSREWAEQHAKHRVPTDFKKGTDTTGKKEIERLAKRTGDRVYALTVEFREAGIMHDNFLSNWEPAPDGRLHAVFKFTPATGQLSASPNVQNAPSVKKARYGRSFRRMIEAKSGHTLVEFDFRSAHSLTMGFEARDPTYMRLARRDIHTFLVAVGLKRIWTPEKLLELTDEELDERLVWALAQEGIGALREKQAKPTVHGYQFGMQEVTLYHHNQEFFSGTAETRRLLDTMDGLFPMTAQFRKDIQAKAASQGFLISLHGFIRRFWEVYDKRPVSDSYQPRGDETVYLDKKGRRWKRGHGADAEAAIAFLPSNDAFGRKDDAMLDCEERGWNERYELFNDNHDNLLFECPDPLVEECAHNVRALMEEPSRVLVNEVAPEGLAFGVDVKVGPNWAEMRKWSA
jgi:uracil-DNA glycosylase family 4